MAMVHDGEPECYQMMSWRMFCDWNNDVQMKQTLRMGKSQFVADAVPWLLTWLCHSHFLFAGPACPWTWKFSPIQFLGRSLRLRKDNAPAPLPTPFQGDFGLIPSVDSWAPELLFPRAWSCNPQDWVSPLLPGALPGLTQLLPQGLLLHP